MLERADEYELRKSAELLHDVHCAGCRNRESHRELLKSMLVDLVDRLWGKEEA
jgi:hypothetical protein